MRRLIAALSVSLLTASTLALVSEPAAAANPSQLGPRVIYVDTSARNVRFTIDGADAYTYPYSSFAVKGNSSANWPKKPYGVTFKDNQQPFGLPLGRSFRLLANYHDRSLLRNWISYDLARKMSGLTWTPHSVFTEMFINGKYQGSYQMIETVAISSNRIAIPRSTGQIGEFDAGGSLTDRTGMRTSLKDPTDSTRGDDLMTKVNKFTWHLDHDEQWPQFIDMASFVDYYLVREFTKDKDADFLFSNFYYTPDVFDSTTNSKLFMGPVWDFDRSAGNEAGITSTTVASPKYWWLRGSGAHHPWDQRHWYVKLTAKASFRAALCERFTATAGNFQYAGNGAIADAYKAAGGSVPVTNDRKLWGSSNVERPPSRGAYGDEIAYLSDWYKKRYYWMRDNIC